MMIYTCMPGTRMRLLMKKLKNMRMVLMLLNKTCMLGTRMRLLSTTTTSPGFTSREATNRLKMVVIMMRMMKMTLIRMIMMTCATNCA